MNPLLKAARLAKSKARQKADPSSDFIVEIAMADQKPCQKNKAVKTRFFCLGTKTFKNNRTWNIIRRPGQKHFVKRTLRFANVILPFIVATCCFALHRFPFIIAVKGKNKEEILNSFRQRITNNINLEFEEAKKQVKKIASFRLGEIIK